MTRFADLAGLNGSTIYESIWLFGVLTMVCVQFPLREGNIYIYNKTSAKMSSSKIVWVNFQMYYKNKT